jgi:hypothetical protein
VIGFICPSCNAPNNVPNGFAGKPVLCRECGRQLIVPAVVPAKIGAMIPEPAGGRRCVEGGPPRPMEESPPGTPAPLPLPVAKEVPRPILLTKEVPNSLPLAEELPLPVYIGPWAFLRTMALIAWSAFRHPFSTTTIDMLSGECTHE